MGEIRTFLKDVLIVSLGAYGGPEAHYGVFAKQMVDKRGYISEDELYEYMAMTSVLPGPSSTQTLMAIGYHVGGMKLALLTLLVWALPIGLFLSGAVFLYARGQLSDQLLTSLDSLAYVAIGFVFYAAFRMLKKGWKTPTLWGLGLISFWVTLFVQATWIFPFVLIGSGVLYSALNRSEKTARVSLIPLLNGPLIVIFSAAVIGSFIATVYGPSTWQFIGHFFQFGFLVIGGGQVVIPYMIQTMVTDFAWMSLPDFLIGLGLVQGLPGPMFSFAAWAGGLSSASLGIHSGWASLMGLIGLFLPGALLILIMLPLWPTLKVYSFIKPALSGVIAAAGGLVLSTGVRLFLDTEIQLLSTGLIVLTLGLLVSQKIPAPLIVLGSFLGYFIIL